VGWGEKLARARAWTEDSDSDDDGRARIQPQPATTTTSTTALITSNRPFKGPKHHSPLVLRVFPSCHRSIVITL
jgi:hypothetical protein